MRKFLNTIIINLLLLPLSSCFTGIESTPKITADDVKRENVSISLERRFMDEIGFIPISKWSPGKRFYVTDDKIALVFGASASGISGLKGAVLSYQGAESVVGVTGNSETILGFKTEDGKFLTYKLDSSLEQLAERETVEIPFAIDLDLVDKFRSHLATKRLYVMTSAWYGIDGAQLQGRKYVPVTVLDVLPGNAVYPLYISFIDDLGTKGGVYISYSLSQRGTRNFDTLFSFSNPKDRYPDIHPENWEKIISGEVALGMTRDECRLALGAPSELNRIPTYGGIKERWSYPDGVYLLFEDGLLTDFRR